MTIDRAQYCLLKKEISHNIEADIDHLNRSRMKAML